MIDEFGVRPGLDGGINASKAVEENHNVSLRADEDQQNSIAFEEMSISKRAKVRSIVRIVN
jgi:hypothetical protein